MNDYVDIHSIDGEIGTGEITGDIEVIDEITAEIGVGGVIRIRPEDYDIYDGDTMVKPKVNEQTILPTAQKILDEDITVLEIPYFQTTNPQGGNTIYIGAESEVI